MPLAIEDPEPVDDGTWYIPPAEIPVIICHCVVGPLPEPAPFTRWGWQTVLGSSDT